ncbi:hypothetical protein ACFO9Q_14680 [Paenibacillus sp. GCM10023252]
MSVDMPRWIEWLAEHWLTVMLALGVGIAVAFVLMNRKLLFYKE